MERHKISVTVEFDDVRSLLAAIESLTFDYKEGLIRSWLDSDKAGIKFTDRDKGYHYTVDMKTGKPAQS